MKKIVIIVIIMLLNFNKHPVIIINIQTYNQLYILLYNYMYYNYMYYNYIIYSFQTTCFHLPLPDSLLNLCTYIVIMHSTQADVANEIHPQTHADYHIPSACNAWTWYVKVSKGCMGCIPHRLTQPTKSIHRLFYTCRLSHTKCMQCMDMVCESKYGMHPLLTDITTIVETCIRFMENRAICFVKSLSYRNYNSCQICNYNCPLPTESHMI